MANVCKHQLKHIGRTSYKCIFCNDTFVKLDSGIPLYDRILILKKELSKKDHALKMLRRGLNI